MHWWQVSICAQIPATVFRRPPPQVETDNPISTRRKKNFLSPCKTFYNSTDTSNKNNNKELLIKKIESS